MKNKIREEIANLKKSIKDLKKAQLKIGSNNLADLIKQSENKLKELEE
jgi:hypothetical protein